MDDQWFQQLVSQFRKCHPVHDSFKYQNGLSMAYENLVHEYQIRVMIEIKIEHKKQQRRRNSVECSGKEIKNIEI